MALAGMVTGGKDITHEVGFLPTLDPINLVETMLTRYSSTAFEALTRRLRTDPGPVPGREKACLGEACFLGEGLGRLAADTRHVAPSC